MASYLAKFYIDSKTLDWATREECPPIFNNYIAEILIDALGINGDANLFCKCKYGGYNLSWGSVDGEEYVHTFSEEELLNALQDKIVDYELKVRQAEELYQGIQFVK